MLGSVNRSLGCTLAASPDTSEQRVQQPRTLTESIMPLGADPIEVADVRANQRAKFPKPNTDNAKAGMLARSPTCKKRRRIHGSWVLCHRPARSLVLGSESCLGITCPEKVSGAIEDKEAHCSKDGGNEQKQRNGEQQKRMQTQVRCKAKHKAFESSRTKERLEVDHRSKEPGSPSPHKNSETSIFGWHDPILRPLVDKAARMSILSSDQ